MSPAIFGSACLPWPPSAAGSSAAIFVIPSTRKFIVQQQVLLRARHFARHAQALRARGQLLGFDAQLVDLHLRRRSPTCPRAPESAVKNGLETCESDSRRDFADRVVVVLQRLLLLGFQAAVDEQHDDDQHDHARRRRRRGGAPSACAGRIRRARPSCAAARGRRGARAAAAAARGRGARVTAEEPCPRHRQRTTKAFAPLQGPVKGLSMTAGLALDSSRRSCNFSLIAAFSCLVRAGARLRRRRTREPVESPHTLVQSARRASRAERADAPRADRRARRRRDARPAPRRAAASASLRARPLPPARASRRRRLRRRLARPRRAAAPRGRGQADLARPGRRRRARRARGAGDRAPRRTRRSSRCTRPARSTRPST